MIIGAIGGLLAIACTELIERLKIDDPVGAVPVHGACGIWVTQHRMVKVPNYLRSKIPMEVALKVACSTLLRNCSSQIIVSVSSTRLDFQFLNQEVSP